MNIPPAILDVTEIIQQDDGTTVYRLSEPFAPFDGQLLPAEFVQEVYKVVLDEQQHVPVIW